MPGPKKKFEDFLSIRLEPQLRRMIEELAEGERRTSSQMARILLEEAIGVRKASDAKAPGSRGRK